VRVHDPAFARGHVVVEISNQQFLIAHRILEGHTHAVDRAGRAPGT
jgi:hypothetical protein